jgi:hypothetical protein
LPTYNYGNQENEDTALKKRLSQTAYQQTESGAPLESDTVRQAQEMLKQQSATPGKTSGWQSQLNDTINRILNREQFSYDLNGDALYQQYKDKYMTQGKMAMMDTMGQAQAMTGGYGNSYAQGVGQQAYHGYLQQLNDRVPELYQLALNKYQMEGDQMYDQAALLAQMDRYQTADKQWQDEFDEAKRRYDQEYAQKYGIPVEGSGNGGGGTGNGNPNTSDGPAGGYYNNGSYNEDFVKRAQAFVGAEQNGKWGSDSAAKAKAKGYHSLEEVIRDIQGRYNPGGSGVSPTYDKAYTAAKNEADAFMKNLPYLYGGGDVETWKKVVDERLGNAYESGALSSAAVEYVLKKLGLN